MSSNFLLPFHFPICRMHADIRTPTWLCKAGAPSFIFLSPGSAFPIRQYTSWHFFQEGCCKTVYWALCSSVTLVTGALWSAITKKKKKNVYQLLVSFMCCVLSNHPSFLLFRTPLLWGTCHTGDQRNPTGKIATAVLSSRRAFWVRCSPLTISNSSSILQASPAGTLHHG